MKRTLVPILTIVTLVGMAIWGPWFLLVGLGLAIVGGIIEGDRDEAP